MKILRIISFFLMANLCFSQTDHEGATFLEQKDQTHSYTKDIDYSKKRSFKDPIKSKYSGREFTYSVEQPKPRKNQERESANWNFLSGKIRVIILILLAILSIAAILYRSDFSYFKLKKYRKNEADKLVSEEDSIHEKNYEHLIRTAIHEGNFRMATRYYYLSLLKKLTDLEYITYHKDKTNSDYYFELKDANVKSEFSYLSYIYSYVWYGEFPIDAVKFSSIETNYQSFINKIK